MEEDALWLCISEPGHMPTSDRRIWRSSIICQSEHHLCSWTLCNRIQPGYDHITLEQDTQAAASEQASCYVTPAEHSKSSKCRWCAAKESWLPKIAATCSRYCQRCVCGAYGIGITRGNRCETDLGETYSNLVLIPRGKKDTWTTTRERRYIK